MRPSPWQLMEASGFLDPLRVEPPRRGIPLASPYSPQAGCVAACLDVPPSTGGEGGPPFTPSRGSCRAKVRPASGPTLAGRHAASSALSPAMLRLRRHIAGDMRSYTHFSTLYPSASKKLTITKFEIWTMIFPFKVVHNSSSIKKFKTS